MIRSESQRGSILRLSLRLLEMMMECASSLGPTNRERASGDLCLLKGACTYDIRKISELWTPLSLSHSRNLSVFLSASGVPPSSQCGHHMYMPPKVELVRSLAVRCSFVAFALLTFLSRLLTDREKSAGRLSVRSFVRHLSTFL